VSLHVAPVWVPPSPRQNASAKGVQRSAGVRSYALPGVVAGKSSLTRSLGWARTAPCGHAVGGRCGGRPGGGRGAGAGASTHAHARRRAGRILAVDKTTAELVACMVAVDGGGVAVTFVEFDSTAGPRSGGHAWARQEVHCTSLEVTKPVLILRSRAAGPQGRSPYAHGQGGSRGARGTHAHMGPGRTPPGSA